MFQWLRNLIGLRPYTQAEILALAAEFRVDSRHIGEIAQKYSSDLNSGRFRGTLTEYTRLNFDKINRGWYRYPAA